MDLEALQVGLQSPEIDLESIDLQRPIELGREAGASRPQNP